MNNVFKYNGEDLSFFKAKYAYNNALAIVMICDDGSPYAYLTVNLPEYEPENNYQAYIDTNNLGEYAFDWITSNNLGVDTGIARPSGYCIYPLVEFKKEFINSLPDYQ